MSGELGPFTFSYDNAVFKCEPQKEKSEDTVEIDGRAYALLGDDPTALRTVHDLIRKAASDRQNFTIEDLKNIVTSPPQEGAGKVNAVAASGLFSKKEWEYWEKERNMVEELKEPLKIFVGCDLPPVFWTTIKELKAEKHRIEIAMLRARDYPREAIERLQDFRIQNKEALIEIAKLCAQKDGRRMAENIRKFEINDEAALIEIAKVCIQECGRFVVSYIPNFGIKEEKALIEIAKLCAQQDGIGTAERIKDFRIENEEALIEIAKLCAQQSGWGTATNIERFGIKDEKALIEIAKLCAQQDGRTTATNIERFGIKDEKALIEIAKLCAQQSGSTAEFYDDLFETLNSVKDSYARVQALMWLLPVLAESHNFDNEDLPTIKEFIKQCITLRAPAARDFLTKELASTEKSHLEKFGELKAPKYDKKSPGLFLRLISAKLIHSGVKQNTIEVFLKTFETKSIFDIYKDTGKLVRLVEALHLLAGESTLTPEEKTEVLNGISKKKGAELKKDIDGLNFLLKLDYASRLKDSQKSCAELFREAFTEHVPVEGVKDWDVKFEKTFGSYRHPEALPIYAAGLKTLDDFSVTQCLGDFAKSVFENKFKEVRNSTEKNPHLETIYKAFPDLKKKWETTLTAPLSELSGNQGETQSFSYLDWLRRKLVTEGQHLPLEAEAPLIKFLDSKDPVILEELKKVSTPNDSLQLQLECMELHANWNDKEKRIEHLEKMKKLAEKFPEFLHDVTGLLEEQRQPKKVMDNAIVVDTEEAQDILFAGYEVAGSCQRYDGTPDLNKGLLGYLMDGKNRLIAVKDSQGRILARALLRILWDGDKPALFLERIYPQPAQEDFTQGIRNMALKKAEMMDLALVEKEGPGDEYGKSLHALGGPAPHEFVDAVGGIQEGGKFEVESSTIIAQPPKTLAALA